MNTKSLLYGLLVPACIAVGFLLNDALDRSAAHAQDVDVRRGPWVVVPAEREAGRADRMFIMYNRRTGRSYVIDSNVERWDSLRFQELRRKEKTLPEER